VELTLWIISKEIKEKIDRNQYSSLSYENNKFGLYLKESVYVDLYTKGVVPLVLFSRRGWRFRQSI